MEGMRLVQRTALSQLFETRSVLLRQTQRQLQQMSQQPFRTRPLLQNAHSRRALHTQRPFTNPLPQAFHPRPRRTPQSSRGRRYNSSSSSTASASQEGNLSFSQRMKKLSREYGWAALGVYLALTALDLPFCFLAVRMLGTDRVGHWEHVILETFKGFVKWPLPTGANEQIDAAGDLVNEKVSEVVGSAKTKRVLEESSSEYAAEEIEDHGYKEADMANRGADASIWTQLGLAYVIHKSFIFVRVPLVAAITPKVVKTLRSWGWNIGKMPSRKAVTSGSQSSGTTAGVSTKGSKVKPDD